MCAQARTLQTCTALSHVYSVAPSFQEERINNRHRHLIKNVSSPHYCLLRGRTASLFSFVNRSDVCVCPQGPHACLEWTLRKGGLWRGRPGLSCPCRSYFNVTRHAPVLALSWCHLSSSAPSGAHPVQWWGATVYMPAKAAGPLGQLFSD